jgi:hypothetical protein
MVLTLFGGGGTFCRFCVNLTSWSIDKLVEYHKTRGWRCVYIAFSPVFLMTMSSLMRFDLYRPKHVSVYKTQVCQTDLLILFSFECYTPSLPYSGVTHWYFIKITFTNECTFYLTNKMWKFTIETSIHLPPTCFGPFGPPSGSLWWSLLKLPFCRIVRKIRR